MKATASNQTISWFNNRYKEDALELSPEFQRNPVWQQPQKDYLIETIMLSLPVPEIYYVNRVQPNGDSVYIVVDGQQRLRTIIEFVNNEFEIKHTIKSYPNIKKFDDLSDHEKLRFWSYMIVVRDLEDSTDDDVRDLFQRINKYSIVLNDQELRNARFKGNFLQLIQKIGEHDYWTSSGIFSVNDIRRMLDLEYISILMASLIGGIFNRKERVDEFYVMYEEEFDESNYYNDRFIEIIELIDTVLPELKKTKWKNKVNFYSLFLALETLNLTHKDTTIFEKLTTALSEFEDYLELAKNEADGISQDFIDYYDAATYGTNDKEKRLRRHRILTDYFKEKLFTN